MRLVDRKVSNAILIQIDKNWKSFYLHTASRRIIDLLVEEGIGTLIIGKNRSWKQEVEMGKKNNQQFVQIPHARFIEMLMYKGALVGIRVIPHEESYTSKASFLDLDPLPAYDPSRDESLTFSGRRSGRWYYASGKRILHSDVNGIFRYCSPPLLSPLSLDHATIYSKGSSSIASLA
jgi:putative transposase